MIIGRVTLDGVTWTAIKPPIDCYHIRLYNVNTDVGIKFRSNDTDANSEITIDPMTEKEIRGTRNSHFQVGTTIGYGQTVSGTKSLVLLAEN